MTARAMRRERQVSKKIFLEWKAKRRHWWTWESWIVFHRKGIQETEPIVQQGPKACARRCQLLTTGECEARGFGKALNKQNPIVWRKFSVSHWQETRGLLCRNWDEAVPNLGLAGRGLYKTKEGIGISILKYGISILLQSLLWLIHPGVFFPGKRQVSRNNQMTHWKGYPCVFGTYHESPGSDQTSPRWNWQSNGKTDTELSSSPQR